MSNFDAVDRQELREALVRLENEHAELDDKVNEYTGNAGADQMVLSRMKRRKLQLKDAIVKIRSQALPDLPA